MTPTRLAPGALVLALLLAAAAPHAAAQSAPGPWGRISFTAQSFTATEQGRSLPGFAEIIVSTTFASPVRKEGGTEYRLDMRGSGYPQADGRARRVSVYDAYIGQRFHGGTIGVRAGQMWLNELGGLGSLGGALVEVIRPQITGQYRLRIGAFGGVEPRILDAGYVANVRKAGGYVTLEGTGAWRNTVGFVTVRNSGLTERSVLTTTNFLPFGKRVLVYQMAEFDLTGPAGNGSGGLTFLFVNGRYSPIPAVELQGVFHRGRSIDARGITLDQLAGRPVSARALEGLLYESAGGRVMFTVARGIRLDGGYARDRNNRDDAPTSRVTFGGSVASLFGSGIDLRVSDARVKGPTVSYDSWDVSLGRNVTARVYVSGEYSSSLSSFRLLGGDGSFVIEARPRTNRYTVSSLFHAGRFVSLLGSVDRTEDGDYAALRWMLTLMYRF